MFKDLRIHPILVQHIGCELAQLNALHSNLSTINKSEECWHFCFNLIVDFN